MGLLEDGLSARSRRRGIRTAVYIWVVVLAGSLTLAGLGIFARPSGLLGELRVDHVTVDLPSGKYRVAPALASDGREEFSAMMDRLKPFAAVCGTYYDSDYNPLGDILVDGKVVRRGGQRQAIGFTSSGKIRFIERKGRDRIDWSGCRSGIACGPRLLRAGRPDIDVKRDGFSSAADTTKAWRCAAGATRDGKLVLCAVSERVTLATLAAVMQELGAWDAINLDGGSMCALYKNGKCAVEPVAPVNNILAVYRR